MRPRQPHAPGRVFPVHHDEIELPGVAQARQVFGDGAASGTAHDVAKEENFHAVWPTPVRASEQETSVGCAFMRTFFRHRFGAHECAPYGSMTPASVTIRSRGWSVGSNGRSSTS